MKIGILTYHKACNFGANLQLFSTYNYIRNQGHTPIIINWSTKALDDFFVRKTPVVQYEEHRRFREENLLLTRSCYTIYDVAKVIEEEDIKGVIIGSDAVLQHHPLLERLYFSRRKIIGVKGIGADRMCPNPFWGSFIPLLSKDLPVCMMSASSQNSEYHFLSLKEREMLKEHLLRFSYISTRDDWTSKMVSNITKGAIVPEVTPDPVFAFNYNVTNQLSEDEIRTKYHLEKPYYVFSFLDDKTVDRDWLDNFQRITDKDCIALPFPYGVRFNHPFKKEIGLPLSPLEWYALIKYSSGYIGHNMHPIVVSLHNSVPCFSFDNYGLVRLRYFVNEKSSKIYHILKEFDLLGNRVSCKGNKSVSISANRVLELLDSYDKHHVMKMGKEFHVRYEEMMCNIMRIVTKG